MRRQGVVLKHVLFCFCSLLLIASLLVESTLPEEQESGSKIETAQDRESRNELLSSSSSHRTSEVLKPSQIRNRRNSLSTEKRQFYDDNGGLDSAFLYNDQIMQNLLNSHSSKPLSYARSNFFLNYLKPRTTRYNAWDDHSLMHFGKRSIESNSDGTKMIVKRSADLWSPNNVLHFGKKSGMKTYENALDEHSPNFNLAVETIPDSSSEPWINDLSRDIEDSNPQKEIVMKKAEDPWHSLMSFGKKSQSPWDHNTLHFGKKDDISNELNPVKRYENFWDHNTMHFGKRDDPWHNMMSFGKRFDNSWDHNTLHFGKKDDPWHNMMSFGKRFDNSWDHNTLHFGKRDPWDHNTLHFGKRDPWDHNTLHFGKKDEPWHSMMSFGKKSDPWHSMMSFGKRYGSPWDHNTLHFGKKDDPWHNMMSFGKKSENYDMTDLEKREDPWHNMMSFGKKSDGLWNNSIASENKREEPWHSMSFGKKFDSDFGDHFTLHFGKREEPWHSMMSFGKKADYGFDHNTLHFGKKDEPWHSMMSFGKKSENPWDHNTLHFGKREEPWHSMMSFGKKFDPWVEHNTLHFGKRDDPWHNMMSFGKRPAEIVDDLSEDFAGDLNPWEEYSRMAFYKKSDPWDNTLHFQKKSNISADSKLPTPEIENVNKNRIEKRSADMWNDHHTMHFGKKFDPWDSHNTMHFGKKSDPWESHNTMHFGKKSDPWESHNTMHFGKRAEEQDLNLDKKFGWDSHNTMHFGKRDPWDYHNTMHFGKRDPWDYHNTMHFGKRDPWDQHNTMNFGKRDPWDQHNTMHFGKRDPWDQHNTMHFGKRDPWDYHNTMHFGKKSESTNKDKSTISDNNQSGEKEDKNSKETPVDKAQVKEVSLSKRSSVSTKTSIKPKNSHNDNEIKTIMGDNSENKNDNQKVTVKSKFIKRTLKNVESNTEKNKIFKDDKVFSNYGLKKNNKEEQTKKPNTVNNSTDTNTYKQNDTLIAQIKSRINKRSVDTDIFMTNNNENLKPIETNTGLFDGESKDDFPDSVLHFGKRSVEFPSDNEVWSIDGDEIKRFDNWDNHNTLHFGKKSDPWDTYNTLHFGKKSSPWENHSTMHFGKRDPWDYHNTLHFGKKFDPWEGHAKMHFGKRTNFWDHNVMHFGKRDELAPEVQALGNSEDLLSIIFDPAKLKIRLQEKSAGGGIDSDQNRQLLEDLENLEQIIKSYLADSSMPFEEKVSLLKSYLKPVLKEILTAQIEEAAELEPLSETVNDFEGGIKNGNEEGEILRGSNTIPFTAVTNDINSAEGLLKRGSNDNPEEESGENYKTANYGEEYGNPFKVKRNYLGKSDLKRYFGPFQGPKSIIYPHAWFASQIRRSSLPRTTEYARNIEMRMAEKKEDPFNSYMHFGRR